MTTVEAPKVVINTGCYLRISSDPKDKREGVDRQREDCTALCEIKGWTPAEFYVDNDRSASSGKERPEWDRLLADVAAGKIDAVAAWDQDRGWRMMSELEQLRKFFSALGRKVPLATTGQGDIDLYSPTGVLAAQIKTAVSEHEIAMMKVRMKRAARQKAEQGRPQWKRAFGYHGETYQPDPQTAPLVVEGYNSVLAGGSISDVARSWNEAGAYGLNGKPWKASTVSLFLRSPRNAGLRSHNGEIVGTGNWPALVPQSTWKAAQAVLNAPGRAPGRKSCRQHKLTGVMRCGKEGCSGYLAGNWQMNKTSGPRAHAIVYRCKTCLGVSIRAEHIEPLVYEIVSVRLAQPDAVDLLKAEHDEAQAEAIRAELNALHQELRQIGIERGQRLLTGEQAKIATDLINADIAELERRQQDQERLRIFADLPLGTPEVGDAVRKLSDDRLRAVLDVLVSIRIMPVGKGNKEFRRERVLADWH